MPFTVRQPPDAEDVATCGLAAYRLTFRHVGASGQSEIPELRGTDTCYGTTVSYLQLYARRVLE
jgi:hypothetical protein